MAKAKTEDIVKEIFKSKSISEQEINLLKRRLNAGEKVEGLEYMIDDEISLTGDQNAKGKKYLKNVFRTPKGAERKNHPFGYREQEAIDSLKEFYFAGFHNPSFFGKNFQPVYTAVGKDANFDYQLAGGKLEILG